MRRIAWFHCFSGVAGDMALGALLDAGADLDNVRNTIERLGIDGWALDREQAQRCGIGATRALVTAPDQEHHRAHAEIRQRITAAELPATIAAPALATFAALAEVEGAIHGVPVDEVEFHEVGSLDAIVDIVGVCAALSDLGIDEVRSSPITLGTGTFRAAHGVLPNPGPAVLSLLAGAGAPHRGVDVDKELATPTGVALMTTLATGWGPIPDGVVRAVGYGAGGRDLPGRPNVVQVVIVETTASGTAPQGGDAPHATDAGQPVRLFEANLDDATPEVLAHTVTRLIESGAYDAWITPIVMKKGRPAHTVHVLCDPARADEIAAVLVAESGSLGLRATTWERWPQRRTDDVVDVDGHAVRVKRSGGRVKPELDDAVAAARALAIPLRHVLDRVAGSGHTHAHPDSRLIERGAHPDTHAHVHPHVHPATVEPR